MSPENSADPLFSALPAPPAVPELTEGAAPETETVSTAPVEAEVTPDLAAPELEPPSDQTPPGEPARNSIAEWVITILLLLFLTTTQVQAFVIPSGSMEETLLIGDHLLVDKMAYAPAGPVSKYILPYHEPKRGDIIVFRYPTDIQQTFVKRCMGVPGDHIRIVNKEVYLNGHPLTEPYKYDRTEYIDSYRDNFPSEPNEILEPGAIDMLEHHVVNGEIVVPPNSYFAMGDNRENSLDSRYWGFVPRQNIIGKPLLIYWSFDRPGDERESNTVTIPQMVDLATHFFSKTRWRRSFTLLRGYPVQ